MLDVVVKDGAAAGIVVRDLLTGEISSHSAHAVVLATGGYSQRLLPLDQRHGLQRHRDLARPQRGARVRQPVLHADPPDLHPGRRRLQSKLTLMSESLRNDGRIWVPEEPRRHPPADQIPEDDRDYYLERRYPALRQPRAARRRIAAPPRSMVDAGRASAR